MLEASSKCQPYQSELCSAQPSIRGVAISRFVECLYGFCEAITSDDELKHALDGDLLKALKVEAATISPHLRVLIGADPSSCSSSMQQAGLCGDGRQLVDPGAVERAVAAIEQWLDGHSKLRATMRIMQQGGLPYCSQVETVCLVAYRKCGYGKEAGTMTADAVAHLCQGGASESKAASSIAEVKIGGLPPYRDCILRAIRSNPGLKGIRLSAVMKDTYDVRIHPATLMKYIVREGYSMLPLPQPVLCGLVARKSIASLGWSR